MTKKTANIMLLISVFFTFSGIINISNLINPSVIECREGCVKVTVPIIGERCVCPPSN